MHAILMNMANLKEGLGLGKTAYEPADAMMLYRCKEPAAGEGAS